MSLKLITSTDSIAAFCLFNSFTIGQPPKDAENAFPGNAKFDTRTIKQKRLNECSLYCNIIVSTLK